MNVWFAGVSADKLLTLSRNSDRLCWSMHALNPSSSAKNIVLYCSLRKTTSNRYYWLLIAYLKQMSHLHTYIHSKWTYIRLHHVHSTCPHERDIFTHVDFACPFALLIQSVKCDVSPRATDPSAKMNIKLNVWCMLILTYQDRNAERLTEIYR